MIVSSLISVIGRVAAGAIAEKYLKQAFGIEIVAFVSSVGKVHLSSMYPGASSHDQDNDDVEDVLSPEYCDLLANITREEVDKYITRCPHSETSERMVQVGHCTRSIMTYIEVFWL